MTIQDSAACRRLVETASCDGTAAHDVFVDYFRCPPQFAAFDTAGHLSSQEGYFAFGDAVAYGRRRGGSPSASPEGPLDDATSAVRVSADGVGLPFDLAAVVTNLRHERYQPPAGRGLDWLTSAAAVERLYYFLRPALPVAV